MMPLEQAIELGMWNPDRRRNLTCQPLQEHLSLLLFGWQPQDDFSIHEGIQYTAFPITPFNVHNTMLHENVQEVAMQR